MAELKIKVKTAALIDAIEKRKAEAQKKHEKQVRDYAKKQEEWRAKVLRTLLDAADRARAGRPVTNNGWRNRLELPEEPSEPKLDLSHYDADIAVLKMAAQDEITITQTDYRKYIR